MHRPTIIIADDDDILREVVVRGLTAAGYSVAEASDGPSALKLVEAGVPSLLILDWSMPAMDGLEVLRRLQGRPATAKLPVMMLTARGRPEDVRQALDFGAVGYMVKPFEADDLVNRVDKLVKRSGVVWTG